MKLIRVLVAALYLVSASFCVRAQILEMRQVGGKQVTCMHTGMSSDLNDCGFRSDWYAYVFVGEISSITSIENDERRIEIIPEEIFSGKPDTPTTVITSQGLCLPSIAVGDRWLFYLRKEDGKPITLDYYGNDSLPVTRAHDQIETLRRLSNIGNFAILRGTVKRGDTFSTDPLPLAQVFAIRKSSNKRFAATSDQDGKYQFDLLPPGDYNIEAGAVGIDKTGGSLEFKPGTCWDLTLHPYPNGLIKGHIKHSDGSAAANIDVVLIAADNTWYLTTQTDERGRFSFDSLSSGKFVVGVNYPPRPDWFNGGGAGRGIKLPPASTFYSQSPNRDGAQIINLDTDQKIDNINFTLPAR